MYSKEKIEGKYTVVTLMLSVKKDLQAVVLLDNIYFCSRGPLVSKQRPESPSINCDLCANMCQRTHYLLLRLIMASAAHVMRHKLWVEKEVLGFFKAPLHVLRVQRRPLRRRQTMDAPAATIPAQSVHPDTVVCVNVFISRIPQCTKARRTESLFIPFNQSCSFPALCLYYEGE